MKRSILCLMVLVVASIMTSCEKPAVNNYQQSENFKVDVTVDITCENEGCSSVTHFTNEDVFMAPPKSWYYNNNNYSVINFYENSHFDFKAIFEVKRVEALLYIGLELDANQPFELNKKYDINDIVESMTDEAPKKIGTIKIENPYLIDHEYIATSGWIMFTQRRYSETEDIYFTDVAFECEVIDPETGEIILKAENGSMKNMYNLVDKNK